MTNNLVKFLLFATAVTVIDCTCHGDQCKKNVKVQIFFTENLERIRKNAASEVPPGEPLPPSFATEELVKEVNEMFKGIGSGIDITFTEVDFPMELSDDDLESINSGKNVAQSFCKLVDENAGSKRDWDYAILLHEGNEFDKPIEGLSAVPAVGGICNTEEYQNCAVVKRSTDSFELFLVSPSVTGRAIAQSFGVVDNGSSMEWSASAKTMFLEKFSDKNALSCLKS